MPKVTIDVNEEKLKLLLEVADVLEIDRENIEMNFEVPDWHKHKLNERLEEYKAGNALLISWEKFEKELGILRSDEI